jgi:hypothetical protein
MTALEDLKDAFDTYATDSVKTEIVNFSIPGGGTTLNVGETFQFKVSVSNDGHLDMKGVRVKALGTEFADVGLSSASSFGGSAESGSFDLPAQSGSAGNPPHTIDFKGKAKKVTGVGNPPPAKDIVTAQITADWKASWDHLLNFHSKEGAKEGILHKAIAPD